MIAVPLRRPPIKCALREEWKNLNIGYQSITVKNSGTIVLTRQKFGSGINKPVILIVEGVKEYLSDSKHLVSSPTNGEQLGIG